MIVEITESNDLDIVSEERDVFAMALELLTFCGVDEDQIKKAVQSARRIVEP